MSLFIKLFTPRAFGSWQGVRARARAPSGGGGGGCTFLCLLCACSERASKKPRGPASLVWPRTEWFCTWPWPFCSSWCNYREPMRAIPNRTPKRALPKAQSLALQWTLCLSRKAVPRSRRSQRRPARYPSQHLTATKTQHQRQHQRQQLAHQLAARRRSRPSLVRPYPCAPIRAYLSIPRSYEALSMPRSYVAAVTVQWGLRCCCVSNLHAAVHCTVRNALLNRPLYTRALVSQIRRRMHQKKCRLGWLRRAPN